MTTNEGLKHVGEIKFAPTDEQVMSLIRFGDPNKPNDVRQWMGLGFKNFADRPVNRFADILKINFVNLPDSEKEKFLQKGLMFVLQNSKKALGIINNPRERDEDAGPSYVTVKKPVMQKNLGELLGFILQFKNNDLQLARNFLKESLSINKDNLSSIVKDGKARDTIGSVCYALYRPEPKKSSDQEKSFEVINIDTEIEKNQKDFFKRNPNIRLLAFWLDTYTNKVFDTSFLDIYPKCDKELKIQIMTCIEESLLNHAIPEKEHLLVEKVISDDHILLKAIEAQKPNDILLKITNKIKNMLKIDRLIRQTTVGLGEKISAEKFVDFIEENTFLLEYVTIDDLEKIRRKAKEDRDLFLKISDLIEKKLKRN